MRFTLNSKTFHVAAQLAGIVAQGMMGPSADLFHWSPALVNFLHAIVSTGQGAMGVLALFLDPNANKGQPTDAEAFPLSTLKGPQ